MIEQDLKLLQQEIGELRQDLLIGSVRPEVEDLDSYKLATKIDLTVSRLLRLLEAK